MAGVSDYILWYAKINDASEVSSTLRGKNSDRMERLNIHNSIVPTGVKRALTTSEKRDETPLR